MSISKFYKKYISEKRRIKNILLLNRIKSIFYSGTNYNCNCCNKSFGKFKPKGTLVIRKNAECPYCGALERTRLLLFYLQKETEIFSKNIKLLHFAPEDCLYKIFKKTANVEYLNVDINPNLADIQMDITNIKYKESEIDYIICSHVLGHVSDEVKAIKEMFRVLSPQGSAFVLTLIDTNNHKTFESDDADTPEKRLQYYSESDLVRLHGTDFNKRLEAGGFNVEVIDYRVILGDDICKKYCLGDGKRELIFKCTKNSI